MTPKELTPTQAAALLQQGALLIDIREDEELGAGVIPGAAHMPLSRLDRVALPAARGQAVVFHCRSGRRTAQNAGALGRKAAGHDAYLLGGGIDGWRAAGLPVGGVR
jgi:rhodanese-related sulfurtransferase